MDGTRQNLRFHITAERYVIFRALGMGDAHRVLLDDRAFVEIGGDVMRRCADKLHAALIGLLVGVCALEARQERVVDVDDLARHLAAEVIGQNLHVTGQHHEFRAARFDQVHQLRFGLRLVLLRHLDVVEGNVVVDHHFLVIEMVGDDADDIDRQRADLPAIEEVIEAMAETRHHQHCLHALAVRIDIRFHAEFFRHRLKAFGDGFKGSAFFRNEGDAHEELAGLEVVELRTVDDVAALFRQITGNRGDDATGRFAGYGQNIGCHSFSLKDFTPASAGTVRRVP
ncbi:hypothetical protein D3C72_1260050 [compost metagenome]